MAVRIKCKCGKSLKISSKLADKALTCPGCGAKFRIPAAKFKTSAPAAASKPAAVAKTGAAKTAAVKPTAKAKPPAQKPKVVAEPAELDLNPAELDIPGEISSSQSDILDGILPAAGGESGEAAVADLSGILDVLACPYCDEPLGFEAKICVSCGYDLRTGKVLHAAVGGIAAASAMSGSKEDVLATAEPVPTAEVANVAYAVDPLKSHKRSGMVSDDAIKGPKRGFWADAFASFGYPFISIGNGFSFAVAVGAAFLAVFLLRILPHVPCFVLPFMLIGILCVCGWMAALLMNTILESAAGSYDMPSIAMTDGIYEDGIKPFFKFLGSFGVAFGPAVCYAILMGMGVLPASTMGEINILILQCFGLFVWPFILMLFAFNALNMIFRIDLIFQTIFRTIGAYICMWLMLVLVNVAVQFSVFGSALVRAGSGQSGLGGNILLTGVIFMVYVYGNIVSMRLIGLYYLHFKKRFAIVME